MTLFCFWGALDGSWTMDRAHRSSSMSTSQHQHQHQQQPSSTVPMILGARRSLLENLICHQTCLGLDNLNSLPLGLWHFRWRYHIRAATFLNSQSWTWKNAIDPADCQKKDGNSSIWLFISTLPCFTPHIQVVLSFLAIVSSQSL